MKKHVAGFLFFVSIFALFAAGYAVFRAFPIPDIGVVADPEIIPDLGESPRNISVTQAIADPRKKTLAFTLSNGDERVTEVVLAFYKLTADGIHFVRFETVKIEPGQWTAGNTSSMIRYSADWSESERLPDNLYVVASAREREDRPFHLLPFSRDHAAAVLIAKN